jgi:hypothetical protein
VNLPLGALADAILDNLGLGHGAHLLEKLLQLASAKPGGELLDKDSAAISFIIIELRRWLTLVLIATVIPATPPMMVAVLIAIVPAIADVVTVLTTVVAAGGRPRARARASAAPAIIVTVSVSP